MPSAWPNRWTASPITQGAARSGRRHIRTACRPGAGHGPIRQTGGARSVSGRARGARPPPRDAENDRRKDRHRFQTRDAHFVLNEMDPHFPAPGKSPGARGTHRRPPPARARGARRERLPLDPRRLPPRRRDGLRGLTAAEALEVGMRGLAHYRIDSHSCLSAITSPQRITARRASRALDHEEGRALLRFGGLALAFSCVVPRVDTWGARRVCRSRDRRSDGF